MHTHTLRRTALKAVCCFTSLLSFHSAANAAPAPAKTSAADDFATLPGFKLEVVLEADKKVNGSWISLAKDSEGRLMLGGQATRGQDDPGSPSTRTAKSPNRKSWTCT